MPSNGSFWYGRSTGFPGFLYKRNTGVGARRSTKMGPGGVCNSSTDINNKYKPGQGGVGASSTSNRRAKNRHATICNNTIIKPTTNVTYSFTNATLSSNNIYNTIITFTSDGTLTIGSTTQVLIIIKYNDGTPTKYQYSTLDAAQNVPITFPANVSSVSFNFNPSLLPAPNCFPCYMTLGQYSNYTHNPNGYYPCITLPSLPLPSLPLPVVPPSYAGKMGNATFDTSTAGMFYVDFGKYGNDDNGYEYLSFTGMNFFFFGINYGNSDGSVPANSIYMNTNFAFGFGQGQKKSNNWPETWPAILFFQTATTGTSRCEICKNSFYRNRHAHLYFR